MSTVVDLYVPKITAGSTLNAATAMALMGGWSAPIDMTGAQYRRIWLTEDQTATGATLTPGGSSYHPIVDVMMSDDDGESFSHENMSGRVYSETDYVNVVETQWWWSLAWVPSASRWYVEIFNAPLYDSGSGGYIGVPSGTRVAWLSVIAR